LSADKLATLAQGDIGQNDLTDVSKVYALGSVAVARMDGTAFYKRSGEALAIVRLKYSSWWITSWTHSYEYCC
jgi:hypothetical protein